MMNKYKFKINNTLYEADILDVKGNNVKIEVNGKSYDVEIQREEPKPKPRIAAAPAREASEVTEAISGDGPARQIKAPLPGVIIQVLVKPGDVVKTDQKVCTLETMKMENAIKAESDGVITAVRIVPAQSVNQDEVLIEMK
jgi:glutaconyl-CoA/methylmalonyl-CoA decarboxylase subunit gamma